MSKNRILASLVISGSSDEPPIKNSSAVDPECNQSLYDTYLPLAQDREKVQVDFSLVHDGYEAVFFHRVIAWPGSAGELYEQYRAEFSMPFRNRVSKPSVKNALQAPESNSFAQCLLSVMRRVAELMGTTAKNVELDVGTRVRTRNQSSVEITHGVKAGKGVLLPDGIHLPTLSDIEAGQIIEELKANARLVKDERLPLFEGDMLPTPLFQWQFCDSQEWELIALLRYGQPVSVSVSWHKIIVQTQFGPVEIRQELTTDNFGKAKDALPNALKTARDICCALDFNDVVQCLVRDEWVNPILPATREGGIIKA